MYVLFSRAAFAPWVLDGVFLHLVDAIKAHQEDRFAEHQIEYWSTDEVNDKVIRSVVNPITFQLERDWELV